MRAPDGWFLGMLAALVLTGGCAHHPYREKRSATQQVELYNEWKSRCYELSDLFRQKLKKAPYHPIAHRGADKCSWPGEEFAWDADQRNMHVLLANLFYHYDIEVRVRALELLQMYHCERDGTCGELARLLDAHTRASLPNQSADWKRLLHQRTRDFYRHVRDKADRSY